MYTFQDYHKHSYWTNVRVSDSVVATKDYAKRANELGHGILSSVEHGWIGNVWDAYKTAKEHQLKLLVGAEAYWVRDRNPELKDRTNCHIVLLAKNENGRQALNDVMSEANLTGFYGQPRLDVPLILSLPKDDIWVTSACVAGWHYDDADQIWEAVANHFGSNFFFEVQYHNTPSQIALNKHILELRDKLKVPIIMGCDSHYIFEKDAQNRTDFLASKNMIYPDEEGWYLDYPDGDTAYKRFATQCVLNHDQIDEAIGNTNIFLGVEEYDSPIFNTEVKLPSIYPDWTQEQKDAEYQRLVWQGWDAYKHEVPEQLHEHYRAEIQSEIDVVLETHMADYFIIDYHVLKQGKENGGWLTKTGRGSAVSFFTNMLLGFTEVDRIAAQVKMFPDRFMSATRILESKTLPDIDINVADPAPFALAQQQVLGEDHAYPMVAFGSYKVSAAWKLYAKSQGVPFEIANEVSAQIAKYELALKHADEDEKESLEITKFISPQYYEIFEKSKDYQGIITSWSIAPCAYLLYPDSIRRQFGLVRVKDAICANIDGHWAEEAKMLKNDLLTVQVVNQIYQSFHRIGREPPTVNELLKLCDGDTETWSLYQKGCTLCLNQVEKTGTSARVGAYKPTNISELAAFVAAIRPGFASMYKIFESRQPFKYDVKAFDSLIQTPQMPNSFVLYQEQEMAALNYAGIPMSECYTAIKNIAKKRVEKVLAYKGLFKDGFKKAMLTEGKSEEIADKITDDLWQIMEDSARYSFNASHAYCVALDSLYEAWLKAHHPLEFYEVALKIYEKKGDKEKMMALKEEAESYFGIQFPSFRFGQDNRTIKADHKTNSITNSLGSIKGFGVTLGRTLYECGEQNHQTFMDVLKWLDKRSIKSAKVIPLIKIDYFQMFGNTTELLRMVDIFDFFAQGTAKTIKKDKVPQSLYEIISRHSTDRGVKGNELKSFTINDIDAVLRECEELVRSLELPELTYKVRAQNQKELLGYVDLTTGLEVDRKKLYVLEAFAIQNRWNASGGVYRWRLHTKSIGSGKTSYLSVLPAVMSKAQITDGNIIYCKQIHKDSKGYWMLDSYDIIE